MKCTVLLLLTFIICNFSHAQIIRRVTNVPGAAIGVNTYTTVSAAILAASNGDTIYIEPSGTAYDGFTVNKTLNFIGNGNFLDQNPGTPYEKTISGISTIVYFRPGSTNSTVAGLYFGDRVDINGTSGITIKRCRLGNGIEMLSNTSEILIAENYIAESLRGSTSGSSAQSVSVKNNIISNGNINNLKNSIIENNSISYNSTPNILTNNVVCKILNNILDRRQYNSIYDITTENAESTVSNNLQVVSASATLPSPNPDANNNHYTTNFNNIYVISDPWTANPIMDANFQLITGSAAEGIGIDGVDAGAFGGQFPYTLSGLPDIPIITAAISSSTGTTSVPLNVKISVRSN